MKLIRRTVDLTKPDPLTRQQKAELIALAEAPESEIDTLDIPPLTDEQLAKMVPFRLRSKTTLISLRVQDDVLTWLKSKGPGHLSRINAILANVMDAEQRVKGCCRLARVASIRAPGGFLQFVQQLGFDSPP